MAKEKYIVLIFIAILLTAVAGISEPVIAAGTIPGIIQAENYDAMSGVQAEVCSEGTQNVGWIDAGDWMDYNVTVQTTGVYTVNFRVASPYANTQLQLKNGDAVLATVTIPNTGGYQAWATVPANVDLTAGSQTLRIHAVTNGWNFNWVSFTLNGVPTPMPTPTRAATATPTPTRSATPTPGGDVLTSIVSAAASTAIQGAAYSGDGITGTRWESVHGVDPQWIYWDLGSNKSLSRIIIEWEVAGAANYTIQGSTDAANWNTLGAVTNSSTADHNKITTNLGGSYRYVRMYGSSRTTIYGYSIWETYIYVLNGPNPTPGPTNTPAPTPTAGPTPTQGPTPTPGNGTFPMVFQNNTRGYYADNQIYVRFFGMNAQDQWCYLKADGTMTPVNPADANAPDHLTKNGINYPYYSFTLADTKAVNIPAHFTGGRCYISLGSPLYIPIGNNAWGGPDLNNPSDPNADVIYDWYEFTYIYKQVPFGGNTTQVDQFGFPMTVRLRQDATGYDQTVGITMVRNEIFSQYNTVVAAPFRGLANAYRIVAPRSAASFKSGGAYGNYMQAYIDEVWNYYTTNQFVLGTYSGYVVNNQLKFYQNDAGPYYINKPTTSDVMAGAGALATGNTIELALEAEFVAAFNRGVAKNTADWGNPVKYYLNAVKNDYAMFWHRIGIDGRAYGFSYDDVNDQSSVKILNNANPPTSVTIGIRW